MPDRIPMTQEEFVSRIQALIEKRSKRPPRGSGSGYRVLVREPSREMGHSLVSDLTLSESREFIKDVAGGYEEGTLLYIILGTRGPSGWSGGLKETYIVNAWGEAVRHYGGKSSSRGWIPYKGRPIEESDVERLPSLERAISALRQGYVTEE